MYTCHTAIKVSPLAACPTAYPVQNSQHHAQGSVDFRSAVHRRITAPTAKWRRGLWGYGKNLLVKMVLEKNGPTGYKGVK